MSKAEEELILKSRKFSLACATSLERNGKSLCWSDLGIAYIKGYHQAEKDLSDISWIKEVSGVKDMSRAKEEALKAFPPQSIAANYGNIARRDAFEFGYLKAEKDLELTVEDIKKIYFLFNDVTNEWYGHEFSDYGICREVLKRFKDYKERKQQ